jgi:hypothetical protein
MVVPKMVEKMVIILFLAFTTIAVLHSEFKPLAMTQTQNDELERFFTNLGTATRAQFWDKPARCEKSY